ncbi:MAG: ribosomal RNA small subunit methyltransferase G [Pelagibacteraceae bacterium]|nr:MAG: ribosomal RNA small subunit methyltransferase G [Pelagibacteraceae bacterium]
MLNDKLVKFCDDNFDDGKLILTKLYEYKKILIKENETMNLIGKSTIIDLDERHLLDCIQIVKYLPHHEKSLMDIGTGAGLPGIILSIIGFKNLHLVEKSPKKSLFLENCKLRLGLNYVVHNKSISEISNLNIDYVTARAFASIEKIISMTKKIINKQTKFILLKGKTYLTELETINPQKYFWETHPSITSSESKIIIMGAK